MVKNFPSIIERQCLLHPPQLAIIPCPEPNDSLPHYHTLILSESLLRSDCKQRPLLGNARDIHARNNRMKGLCNPFLSNGSVNTPIKIGVLLETVFSIRSMRSGYAEEFSWESTIEYRSSKWAVSREFWRWSWEFSCGILTSGQRRDDGSRKMSLGWNRCQQTACGDCNRLRTVTVTVS
jgi:hypothetical protein